MKNKKNNFKIGHEVITRTEMWRSNWTWGDKTPAATPYGTPAVLGLTGGMRGYPQHCKVSSLAVNATQSQPGKKLSLALMPARESDKMKVV